MKPTQSVWNQIDDAFLAWSSGRGVQARASLQALHGAGWRHAYIDLGLAYTARDAQDFTAALTAADDVLTADSANAAAMLIKADSLYALGRRAEAIALYSTALKIPLPAEPAAALINDLRRAAELVRGHALRIADSIDARLAAAEVSVDASVRFKQSLAIMRGERRVYAQRPLQYFFPGLPTVEFFDSEQFSWVSRLESAVDAIRDEALAVLRNRSQLQPYVEKDHGPMVAEVDIAGSRKWTAFFLYKSGELLEENAALCPNTMAALANVPLTSVSGAMPSVLLSVLEPGAHIPPHHGMTNTRLICHLPLICPSGCSLRVGAEEREWRYGKTLIFDDTIEHEAWNRGSETRVVLLFDVWRPELTDAERHAVSEFLAAQLICQSEA